MVEMANTAPALQLFPGCRSSGAQTAPLSGAPQQNDMSRSWSTSWVPILNRVDTVDTELSFLLTLGRKVEEIDLALISDSLSMASNNAAVGTLVCWSHFDDSYSGQFLGGLE